MNKTNKQLMTSQPLTVPVGTAIGKILEMMEEHWIRHIPVVDSLGNVAGIISDRDLVSVGDYERLRVDDIMSTKVQSVQEEAPVKASVEIMLEKKISSLVVLNGNKKLSGIITSDDILKAFIRLT